MAEDLKAKERAKLDRYERALQHIANGWQDSATGLTEMPPRARRKHMMAMARAALQCRREGDL